MKIVITGRNMEEIMNGLGLPQISNITISNTLADRLSGKPVENLTWSQIKEIIDQHRENTLHIGQEIIDTDGTVYQVANIDTERHEVIFTMKCLLPEEYRMNDDWTNEGGWKECKMRKYLNEEVINQLSDELLAVITPRTFKVSKGNRSEELDTVTDTLFLPREGEVFAERHYAAMSEYEEGGARQWDIFKKTKERVKTLGDEYGDVAPWWLSSPYVGYATYFCIVTTAGAANISNASYSGGVAPCFQIVSSVS